MQQVSTILASNPVQTQSERQPSTQTFSRDEQNLVSWFFASVRTAWGAAKFNSQFGEEDDVRYAKRYWAPKIIKYTRVQLHDMLEAADRQRMNGNDRFQFPDIPQILSLSSSAWERQAHQPYAPALPDMTSKEAKLAERKAALAQLRKEVWGDE